MNSKTCGAILVVFFTIEVFAAPQWYEDDPYFEGYSSNDDITTAQTYNNFHEETWDGSDAFAYDNNYQQSPNSEMEYTSYWGETPDGAESSASGEHEEPDYSETESFYASESAIDPDWDAYHSGSTTESLSGSPPSGCTFYSHYDPFSIFPPTHPLFSGFFFAFGFFNNPFKVYTGSSVYESYSDDITVDLVDAPPIYNDSDSPGDTVAVYEPGTLETPEPPPNINDPYYEHDESAHATDSTQDASYYRNDPNFHYYSYYTADAS